MEDDHASEELESREPSIDDLVFLAHLLKQG